MELSALKPVERVIAILHPADGAPTGVNVSLVSMQDERMKKIKRRITDERMKLQLRGKDFKADDMIENGNQLLFSAMVGWEWKDGAEFHGAVPPFNQANVFKVFEELPWFRTQLEEAIADESAFFQTSEVGSKKQQGSTPVTK